MYSDCEYVRVRSTSFHTYFDIVTIGETKYSGSPRIDTVMPSNFTVRFQSDGWNNGNGFELEWDCLQWGEWVNIDNCAEVMTLKPEYTGTDTRWYKYRESNDTCSKFNLFYLFV